MKEIAKDETGGSGTESWGCLNLGIESTAWKLGGELHQPQKEGAPRPVRGPTCPGLPEKDSGFGGLEKTPQ